MNAKFLGMTRPFLEMRLMSGDGFSCSGHGFTSIPKCLLMYSDQLSKDCVSWVLHLLVEKTLESTHAHVERKRFLLQVPLIRIKGMVEQYGTPFIANCPESSRYAGSDLQPTVTNTDGLDFTSFPWACPVIGWPQSAVRYEWSYPLLSMRLVLRFDSGVL